MGGGSTLRGGEGKGGDVFIEERPAFFGEPSFSMKRVIFA